MSLLSFLEHLATAAPTARREAVVQLARTAAAAALPAALGALTAPSAAAQTTPTGTILDALQTALRVEWLQDEFYGRVLGSIAVTPPVAAGLVPAAIQPDLALIRSQQRQHIALLETFVRASGGIIPARPNYDFTGSKGGARAALFADVFSNTDAMLSLAQALEDLSARAYTGLVPLLQANNDLLDVGVRMLAVEGRHAAHLRQLRRQRGATIKPWISGAEGTPVPTAGANIYAGEGLTVQQVSGASARDTASLLPTTGGITTAEITAAATEAFDEPLTLVTALRIVEEFTY